MKKSNYDIARNNAEREFLKYDQEKIIRKFNLEHNKDFIYIEFVHRRYQINRSSGIVQWMDDRTDELIRGSHNEVMTIFDVLCCSKDYCCLSGEYMGINDVPGVVKTAYLGSNLFDRYAKVFEHRLEDLSHACEALGGVKEPVGDVAYRIDLFDFLPVVLQFWDADEEFPATLKIMWDKNIIDYMRYETTYYALNHLLDRIGELVGQ